MHQHDHQECSFTQAAYSLQTAIKRAKYTSDNVREFSGLIDAGFTSTHSIAAETLKECLRIERDLSWVRDLFIRAAEDSKFAASLAALMTDAGLSAPADQPERARVAPAQTARRQRGAVAAVPGHWQVPPFGTPLSSMLGKTSAKA